ncbi:MAG: YbdD/YjiX family protein [Alphaproteobacteria bacterium]|nr:YbdD/YjiX family protein [Alphaproteobacteria bacterium]
MTKTRTAWGWAVKAARLMVGIPDYDNYVEHRKAHHPGEPIMTYEEFYRERQNARYACEKGRFKGCC